MTNVHVQHKTEGFCRDVGPIKMSLGRFRMRDRDIFRGVKRNQHFIM